MTASPAVAAKPRCHGVNRHGAPCRAPAVTQLGYCRAHEPGHEFYQRQLDATADERRRLLDVLVAVADGNIDGLDLVTASEDNPLVVAVRECLVHTRRISGPEAEGKEHIWVALTVEGRAVLHAAGLR